MTSVPTAGTVGTSASVGITDPAATIATGATLTLASTANGASPSADGTNVALLGNYMARCLPKPKGGVTATTTEAAQSQAVPAHPHAG